MAGTGGCSSERALPVAQRQPGVYVAQVAVGRGVVGVGANGVFERCACLGQPTVRRVQHRQVVVRFGQFGVGLDQRFVHLARRVDVALAGQHHAQQQAGLRVAGMILQPLLQALLRQRPGLGGDEALDVGVRRGR